MSFKKTKVVMLPTNEKAENCLIERFGRISFEKGYFTQEYLNYNQAKSFHLYILSNEEIKEGDWCVNPITKLLFQVKSIERNRLVYPEGSKKIIATTDKLLQLPEPSQSFIEKYVEEYNKGNGITEVLVEYERVFKHNEFMEREFFDALKINPKDNTITIRKVKDSWNRDEVVELAKRYAKRCQAPMTDSKWFEENL